MKVKSLCSFNRSSGRDGAVKTAIKLKTAPDIVPHHAAKSTIVRGAHKSVPTLAVPVKILDALTKLLEFIGFNGAGFRKRQDFCFALASVIIRKGCTSSSVQPVKMATSLSHAVSACANRTTRFPRGLTNGA
jgi:hypothetical protein